ncbi:hypothetical protein KKA27_01875 [Patescibacteria group bacterium]|nr:hypothetical protein [Patescibacteria group bacterium]
MNYCKHLFSFFFLVFVSFVLYSCGPTIEGEMKRILKEKNNLTEEAASTGAAHGLRLYRAKKDSEGKLLIETDRDGNKYYPIDFTSVSTEEKIEKLKEITEIIRSLKDERKLDASDRQFLEYFPQAMKRLERQRFGLEWQLKRYARVKARREFLSILGLPGEKIDKDKKLRDSAYVTCPLVDLEKDIVFKPEYVILAEKENRMNTMEKFAVDWDYLVEEDNPDYPEKDPTKTKIWKNKTAKLFFQTVDIDNPPDRKADYIMVFRFDKQGNQEKYPAISVFHSINGNDMTVVVVDVDDSNGTSFGVPDHFTNVNDVKKGSDLMSKHPELIEMILVSNLKENGQGFKFAKKKMDVFLSQPGQIEVVGAEINKEGWSVSGKYKVVDKTGKVNNFKVFIKYKNDKDTKKNESNFARDIEWVAFKYHSPISEYMEIEGRVVEFYRVKKDFDGVRMTKINIKGKEVTLFPENKVAIQMLVSTLVKDGPYRIDYDSGDQRSSIVDTNGDGVYTDKKTQAKPVDVSLRHDVESQISRNGSFEGP